LYKDLLHLEKKGYEVWSEMMQPLFTEMLADN
jgi:lysophospholipase L1-like esterase